MIYLISPSNNFRLIRYSGNDWGGDLDDRKSIIGFMFFLWERSLGPKNKTAYCDSSTCEAKFVMATSCICYVIWLKSLLKELNLPQHESIEIYVDNKSTIAL